MEYYQEPAKQIPVQDCVDVLVVGAGPAGIAAAVTAARMGAATMLVEQQSSLGGIATSGLMSHWTGSVDSKLYHEILQRSAQANEGKWKDNIVKWITPEKLKLVFWEMADSAGVTVQLYTFASSVILEGGVVKGVITESKSGRKAVMAKVVVDASGDGDIAAKAGVEYIVGREQDGKMQPATLMFKVAGVDEKRAVFLHSFESTYETEQGELQELAAKHLTPPAGHVLLYPSTQPGVVTCNMTNCINIDGTKAEDLTKAERTCRKQMFEIEAFLRGFVPGYENCYIVSSASLMGIRETRHFKGMYTLTEKDVLSAAHFDDWVVKDAYFNFDVHNITGAGLDKTGVQKQFAQKKGYTIPYRCLVPEKVDGLLLAGRNISGTHMAHSNFRAMPICAAIGEGAGAAAALGCRQNCQPREVQAREIQRYL